MAIAPFDATRAVTFDLSQGHLQLADASRGVLVSGSALIELCRSADVELLTGLGHRMGEVIGRAIEAKLAKDGGLSVRDAPLEAIVDHLDGQWGVMGLGRLHFERWGRALVAVVDDSPFDEIGDKLMASLLASALSQAGSAPVRCVRLHREGNRARFFVSNGVGAERVREWLGGGMPWAEALVRLHAHTNPKAEVTRES